MKKRNVSGKVKVERCGGFPIFAAILFVVGVIWLLNDLNVFSVEIPWVPIVLIIVALGIFVNKWGRK